MRRTDELRNVFLRGFALLGVSLLIFAVALHIQSLRQHGSFFKYVGTGMALCRLDADASKDSGWITLEFTQVEQVKHNTFKFTLSDNTQEVAFFPCLVNFDYHK